MFAFFRVFPLVLLFLCGCASAPLETDLYTEVVAADQPLASRAGLRMLEQGGNAVDAAVAAAFTLSVVRPQSCGIGGGGFMVIYLPQEATRRGEAVETTINSREWCPAGVGPDTFATSSDPRASTVGGLAVAVPGSVAGLLHAQEKYGLLERAAVMRPAIEAAEDGFVVDAAYASAAAETMEKFKRDVSLQTRFPFLWRTLLLEGRVREGARIVNPDQAGTLRRVARLGASAFYHGPLADAIVDAARNAGGVLTLNDLARYYTSGVREQAPLKFAAFKRTFITMPPPSSGGVALGQTLLMLDRRDADRLVSTDEPAFAHELAECFKLAFADRAAHMADPAFAPVPTAEFLSPADVAARANLIDAARTFPADYYARKGPPLQPPADHGTSHVSAADRWGGACAATETINLFFGSYVCPEGCGFLLNNQMDDFTARPGTANAFGLRQSDSNLPQPGKRPLSSMTPTIVLDAEGVEAVAGASGGPRIITATTQALLNALVRGDDAPTAVGRPRLHHQWLPDTLMLEPLSNPQAT
ncbi:MAG TPA: gamma-glutamyltransferase, partial [Phycisphaerales bacterium]|nr:gamma-glutamyltransferase [Phycisphaerales bacterium]